MPGDEESSFKVWWRSLPPSTVVNVRFLHTRHGNAGKASNLAKKSVSDDFLAFMDLNSKLNRRSEDSSGPTPYFLPKFTTIQTPKPGTSHYEERIKRSVVGEFNRAETEARKGTCSNGTSHNWLKKYRPKVSVSPHQEDYCDTYSKRKEQIRAKQTAIDRLLAAAATDPGEISRLEDEKTSFKQALERHRHEAEKVHKYYVEATKSCRAEWATITELHGRSSRTTEGEERSTVMKKFNLVLAVGYQMSKLVPYWGLSPQPGSTYLQKLTHDIYGIVNHATNISAVYVFDERVGPKKTDHTISCTSHCLSSLPDWVRRVHLLLDNTCSTNKNHYQMGWAWEMVAQGRFDFLSHRTY